MGNRTSYSSILKELMINIIGTFIGALLAFAVAILIYHIDGKNSCDEQLRLVKYECELNKSIFDKLIIDLKSIKKEGSTILVNPSILRLLTNATTYAYNSEYVSRYAPPNLKKDISIHSANLVKLNKELDAFNNFLYSRLDDPKASFTYLGKWRDNLLNEINRRYSTSEDLKKRIIQHLSKLR